MATIHSALLSQFVIGLISRNQLGSACAPLSEAELQRVSLNASKGQRTLKNAQDGIFRDGGDQLLLALTKTSQGYAATFDIGLQTA